MKVKTDIETLQARIEKAKKQILNANQQIKDNTLKQVYSATIELYKTEYKDIENFKEKINKIFKSNKLILPDIKPKKNKK